MSSDYQHINIKKLREKLGISQKKFAELVGVSLRTIQNYESGGVIPKSKHAIFRNLLKESEGVLESNFVDKNEVLIYDTPEGIIKAPLIGQYANGGYLRGFADPEYLVDQPVFYSTRKHTGGNYVAFEVRGESMNDGTMNAICEGDILLGRELQQQYWTSKFHIPKVFIIVHRTEGITVKEVIEHDVEADRIKCHSWNPDPEYQDFDLYLKDIVQLFYIKEISRNFKL